MAGVFVGIDGGASRVRAMAVDSGLSRGALVEEWEPANVLYSDPSRLASLLARVSVEAARRARPAGAPRVYVYAALAGMDAGGLSVSRARLVEEHLARRGIEAVVDHDLIAAWAAARLEGSEAAAVAGSGSAFIHYNEATGERLILGNHGPTLGDEGSAYEIGATALKRLRAALQGLQPHDCLTATLAREIGARTSEQLSEWAYTQGVIQAPLQAAKTVLDAATECRAAANLVANAAKRLARIIDAGAARAKAEKTAIYGGLTRNPHYMKTLKQNTQNTKIEKGKLEPVAGATWLALQYYSDNLTVTDIDFLNLAKRLLNTQLR